VRGGGSIFTSAQVLVAEIAGRTAYLKTGELETGEILLFFILFKNLFVQYF
jgi:hypothetical protein